MSQFKKNLGNKQINATDKLLATPQTESMVSWMNRVIESGKKMSSDDNYRKKIAKRHP